MTQRKCLRNNDPILSSFPVCGLPEDLTKSKKENAILAIQKTERRIERNWS